MKKKLITFATLSLILTGCSSTNTIETVALKFTENNGNYELNTESAPDSYNEFISSLEQLDVELNQDTSVAVLSSSTANIVSAMDMNVVATTDSENLDDNLKTGLDSGDITNLGNPMSPNLEELTLLQADVVFVGTNMPHQEQYDTIDNLVYVPQDVYADIFYSTYGLISEFNLSQVAHDKFNELVEIDQEAKELAKDKSIENAAALKFAYGDITIAPDSTYVGSLLTELNIDNTYGDLKDIATPMSKEKLLLDNPDTIILYAKGDDFDAYLEELKNDEDLHNLKAYQNNQIYILKSISLNADIDTPQTLLDLSKEVYGNEN